MKMGLLRLFSKIMIVVESRMVVGWNHASMSMHDKTRSQRICTRQYFFLVRCPDYEWIRGDWICGIGE